MQKFKNDYEENSIIRALTPISTAQNTELVNMYNGEYDCYKLGEVLYDNQISSMSKGIAKEIFVKCFNTLFSYWQQAGTYESYLYVFKKIFGEDSVIEFTNIAPGNLQIDITTSSTELTDWTRQAIGVETDNTITDETLAAIQFQIQIGIIDFYYVQEVLNSLVPAGVFVDINFTVV